MTWNPDTPLGTISVKDNRSRFVNNNTYTESKMNVDHYWNIGGDEDGHHKFVQCPKTETGGTPSDPTVATGMDGAIYLKQKTAVESPDFQGVLPYFKDSQVTPGIMEILGIRACCVFSVSAGIVTQEYSHNVTVVRNSIGDFTATFTVSLPSANYIFLGGAHLPTSLNSMRAIVPSGASSKTTALVKMQTLRDNINENFDPRDPLQAWFVVFGG